MSVSDDYLKELLLEMLAFESISEKEGPVQRWVRERFDELGLETYTWDPDPQLIEAHPSFPPLETLDLEDRPSVGGVIELGDPSAGPTIVLNGHGDVVPATDSAWTHDPFAPTVDGDQIYARGALDMKGGLIACLGAALTAKDRATKVDGRIVVESVVGEEDGGVGAATAAASNPYPFERDAVVIAEPTGLEIVTAAEGSLMKRLTVYGKSAHAATRWEGESVLPHFEKIRTAFEALEQERCERLTHPLYDQYEIPWPVNVGTVAAGDWASTVPAELEAEIRIGVAPMETVGEVEEVFESQLADVVQSDDWLREHPPDFERFSVQFEPSEIDREEPIVSTVAETIECHGMEPRYIGLTGGTDARHFIDAGIPAVVFGPGSTGTAHQPDEYVDWAELRQGRQILADVVLSFLQDDPS